MRKDYVKPVLFAETFQMVEHIASCDVTGGSFIANHNNAWVCSVDDGSGLALFMDDNGACTGQSFDPNLEDIDELIGDITGGQCYTVYVSGPMFSS